MTEDPRRASLYLVGGTDVTLDALVRRNDIDLPPSPDEVRIVRVRVDLDEAAPPIWRRLELRGDLTLDLLHEVLQTAMGWTDSHLHRFQPGTEEHRWDRPYFLTDWDVEEGEEGTHERDARLDQVVRTTGDRLCYVYDFGDDWSHTIEVESVRAASDDDVPAVCVNGGNACPPEDVGGIHTYNELAAALRGDPQDVDDLDIDDLEGFLAWLPAILARLDPRAVHAFAAATPLGGLGEPLDPDPDVVSQAVRPWKLLLEQAGETGIVLTGAGYLKPALVSLLFTELGMDRWWIGMGNREDQTRPVALLRQSAQQMGLLRKHKGQLLLTRRGQAVRDDDHALWEVVVAGLATHRDLWMQDARTLYLLHLAAGLPAGRDTDIAEAMTLLGWRRDGVTPMSRGDVRSLTAELRSLLLLVGGLTAVRGVEWEATEAGRVLARAAVTSQAG